MVMVMLLSGVLSIVHIAVCERIIVATEVEAVMVRIADTKMAVLVMMVQLVGTEADSTR